MHEGLTVLEPKTLPSSTVHSLWFHHWSSQHILSNRGLKLLSPSAISVAGGHCLSEDGCYGHALKLDTQEASGKGLGIFSAEGESREDS